MVRKALVARVTSKGQITVPQEIRRRLGLRAGDRLEFVPNKQGTFIRRAKTEDNPFTKYEGILGGFPGGLKEINAWISDMRDPD